MNDFRFCCNVLLDAVVQTVSFRILFMDFFIFCLLLLGES